MTHIIKSGYLLILLIKVYNEMVSLGKPLTRTLNNKASQSKTNIHLGSDAYEYLGA